MRDSHKESSLSKAAHETTGRNVETVFDPHVARERPKKKRKLSSTSEKKYICPEEGCGKKYSRAEHLYRHQLNHAPKQIYYCDFDGCERHFVRQDLCTRHRERHTKTNSHLSRKEATKSGKSNAQPTALGSMSESTQPISPRTQSLNATELRYSLPSGSAPSHTSPRSTEHVELANAKHLPVTFAETGLDPHLANSRSTTLPLQAVQTYHRLETEDSGRGADDIKRKTNVVVGHSDAYTDMSNVRDATATSDLHLQQRPPSGHNMTESTFARPQRLSNPRNVHPARPVDSYLQHSSAMYSPPQRTSSAQYPNPYGMMRSTTSAGSTPSLPPFGLPFMGTQYPGVLRSDSVTSFASKGPASEHQQPAITQDHQVENSALLDRLSAATSMSVFDQETFHHMQFGMGDEFMGWLFSDEQSQFFNSPHPFNPNRANECEPVTLQQDQYNLPHGSELELFPNLAPIPSVVDSSQPESKLSGSRRRSLLNMILNDFKDERHPVVTETRNRIMQGNHDDEGHVLSLRMLQIYISSFWLHMHSQLPIMHRPTFSADTCPDLLLIAIMTLGASCLEKTHGYEVTQACSDLSFFLAWHARHQILQDPDFLPPAKLWVFQALLLLEIFEKLYSTRSLHERAHVHHATTLTLMRRGSSLIGRSASDHILYEGDSTRPPPGPNGSINTSGQNTPDAWWNHWISNEATRRAASAAFILDITHATMFGHSAVMVAHEMRIPLPCDEALWSANSGEEARKVEQSLLSCGLKPLSFLEGLKKTLNGQPIRTNTFGRVTIMAGLLSVSWHMKMQDVRASSIGVGGKQGSWAAQLMHAFDHWKKDFDASLSASNDNRLQDWYNTHGLDTENVFESRTVLHHLAHMAMHVDIIDCQIFAGAKRLLGRTITSYEYNGAVKRMKESWAGSARARDATFYALRFLSEVLTPDEHVSGNIHHASTGFSYSARDDHLLNRPWVLYFATLVVWSYGYALDGPIAPPTYTLSSHETKISDMQGYLKRVGGVRSPEDLKNLKHRNSCLGLLMLLRDMFRDTRWELLHEASDMLGNCIELLMPGIPL